MMVECIDLPPDALRTPARQINVRGEWVPFIVLRELFALPPADEPEFVVMVDYADHRAGIVVDRLIGEVQAVIKPLGELFKSLRYVSGSTILGNGQPALILDVPSSSSWPGGRNNMRSGNRPMPSTASEIDHTP